MELLASEGRDAASLLVELRNEGLLSTREAKRQLAGLLSGRTEALGTLFFIKKKTFFFKLVLPAASDYCSTCCELEGDMKSIQQCLKKNLMQSDQGTDHRVDVMSKVGYL
jgi:hypothetical protein